MLGEGFGHPLPFGGSLDDLTDVDTTTTPPTDGQALVFDDAADEWTPGTVVAAGLAGLVVVEAGSQASATTGAGGISVDWRWGIDASGDPYFESAGVTAGEEAVLAMDPTTGVYSLIAVTA